MTLTKELVGIVAAAVTATGGGTWAAHEWLHDTFGKREALLVAGAQLQYIMSRQEAAIVRDIAFLEQEQTRRPLKAWEKDRLKALREELKEMREVRKGK